MSSPIEFFRLSDLTGIDALAQEARSEGFLFLDRLIREWAEGTMRFEEDGEALFGAFVDDRLVGTAGLTRQGPRLGRLRRVYVSPAYRRRGIAKALVGVVLNYAQSHLSEVVLFAERDEAKRLYESFGFQSESPDGRDRATHRLILGIQ